MLIKSIKSLLEAPFDAVKEWLSEAFVGLIVSVADASYGILLAIALIALFLCVSGYKEGKKYISLSTAFYFLLQCLKAVVRP